MDKSLDMDKSLEIAPETMLITDIQLGVMEYLNYNPNLLVKILNEPEDRKALKNFLDIIKYLNLTRYGNVINLISDNQKTYKNHIKKFSKDTELTELTHLLSTKISVLHKFDNEKYQTYRQRIVNEYSDINTESTDQVMAKTQEVIKKLKDIFGETFRIWASDA